MVATYMTKEQTLNNFFSGFGLLAYEENAVPTGADRPDYPYITYEVIDGSLGDVLAISMSLWYRGSSWTPAHAKKREIAQAVGRGGKLMPCDGGGIWIRPGSPFARDEGDESDDFIKRIIFNLMIEYITEI